MSYLRPRALSGVTSKQPGRAVNRHALSGLGAISTGTVRHKGPDWYRHTGMAGDELSEQSSELAQLTPIPDSDAQWKAELLKSNKDILAAHKAWGEGDLFWKRMSVLATVSIPLMAAIWRLVGVGRKRSDK